jgi:hypothetical protein
VGGIVEACPFCEGAAEVSHVCWRDIAFVKCLDDRCGASGPTSTTEEGAVHKWNSRPIKLPMAEYVQ